MFLRKALFLLVVLLMSCSLSFAGELTSKEAVNYFNDGVKAQKECKLQEAEMNYQKTILLDPSNRDLQKFIVNNRGVMYVQQGDLEKAEAAFNEVLKMDPNYRPAQLNLGFIYDKTRSRLESIEYWLKILNINLDELKPKDYILEESRQKSKS
jgi:tetratricopeptide (TPR) repeat protein